MSAANRAGASDIETRYRALFDTMGPAVLLMRGAECIDCNPATLTLFGLESRDEILGRTPLDFAPELQPNGTRSRELVEQNIALAMRHGTHTFEWQSIRKSGEPFLMEVRFTPCGRPEELLFLCIAVDVSERRGSELALRASEARFRALVENAAEGMLVVDVQTQRVRYANPEICRMLGYEAAELLSMHPKDLHAVEVHEELAAGMARTAAGARTEAASLPMRRKDGSGFDARVRSTGIEFDCRPCLLAMFTDLTEVRLTEAERLKAQKLEALGALAGGIAHDFNNLLQAVFGFIFAAQAARDLEDVRVALGESQHAMAMATRLTNQLLTFSRGGAPVKKQMNLAPIVERAAKFALSGSAARCQFEFCPSLPPVEADEGQIEQVVQNLVTNASQAMPQGGIIQVSTRVETLETDTRRLNPGRYVVLEVRDTGIGIPQGLVSRIFDPYFSTKQRGSGLGLATAYSVVRNHGGIIEVTSEPGRGSTFTVLLPASVSSLQPVRDAAPASSTRSARVLVMDDDPMVRSVAAKLLELLGHTADVVADGAEAVESYRARHAEGPPYDLVILDLTVPGGMGGIEALVRIRAIEPSVRAIVSSGYSDDDAISSYKVHGFRAVLQKPYSIELLEQTVAGQLGASESPTGPG
jgi:two-component system, cell cycle sensor histidine kinase and response regulator CckA